MLRRPVIWLAVTTALLAVPAAALSVSPFQAGVEKPIDPDDELRKIQDRTRDIQDEDSETPVQDPGGSSPYEIGEGVYSTLSENWLVASIVAGGIIGSLFVAWLLASRYIDPTVALQSPERSMLYGFIKGNPGVHLKQLSGEFSMKTSTVLWHVRKLECADLVRSKKANGYRVFYPVSGGIEASQVSEAVTALANDNARTVFLFLTENPSVPARRLGEHLPINGGTIRWHLKKLKGAGLLDEAEGFFRITDLGVKAWNQLQGLPQPVQVPATPVPATVEVGEIKIET